MKTTIKVDVETRELVRAVTAARSVDFDEAIRLGMQALQRQARRDQMRAEALALANDPDDLAEAQQVLAEMEAWGAR